MTRLYADLLLLITAIIWGTGFIAQKLGMTGLGPMIFIAIRFSIAFFATAPMAYFEYRRKGGLKKADVLPVGILCGTFFAGVTLQQFGILTSTVTNAGFLTSLYVLIVPFIVWGFLKQKPRLIIWPGCLMAITGVFLLSGGSLDAFGIGDWLLLGCAIAFAFQVVLMGQVIQKTEKPMMVSLLQYATCAVLAWLYIPLFERFNVGIILDNAVMLLYSGLVATAIAYTLQAVAQRYTPASDTAIILSGESLFAALAGYWILHERLQFIGWIGCALIFASILLVEAGVYLFKSSRK